MKAGSWPFLTVGDLAVSLRRNSTGFTRTDSVAAQGYRKIIGGPGRAGQRKMPPLLRIVDEALPRHRGNQRIPPAALRGADGFRRGVRLEVGTVVAGPHVDAAFRRAVGHGRGTVGVGLVGIEPG